MKVVSTDALTKLIQLVKSAFIKVEDVTETQEVTLADVATTGDYDDLINKPTIPAAQVNSDWNASSGVAQILNKPTLATVATSGSYNDLSNKPTIPSEVTESTVSGWGFTKNTGTVTSVNNVQPVNGNVTLSIPDTSNLANKDLSNLSSTGNAKFQAPLVSGTNIKTINNNSILGNGNLTLDGLPTQTGQSGKYLTTNGTVPSWADVQSLPSQTGKAGKFLQTDGTDASWESAPFRNIGEIVSSTIPLTDAGLHLLDGSLIQGSGIYSAFVTYIAGLVSTYPNLFVTESAWQSSVTTYGVCGKFVYDSTNNTVRLPKVTGKVDGTTDVNALGDLKPLLVKLPNITGTFAMGKAGYTGNGVTANGAFYRAGDAYTGNSASTDGKTALFGFSASRSSSVYSGNGTDTTIHEQAINVLLYIVIATSTKTDIEVDIDEVVTDLNGKADVDYSNCTYTPMRSDVVHIVETYSNGTSWYRIWSDKWCEQGGMSYTATSGLTTIQFIRNYASKPNVMVNCQYVGSAGTSYAFLNAVNITNSNFQIRVDAQGMNWQACGYIN